MQLFLFKENFLIRINFLIKEDSQIFQANENHQIEVIYLMLSSSNSDLCLVIIIKNDLHLIRLTF